VIHLSENVQVKFTEQVVGKEELADSLHMLQLEINKIQRQAKGVAKEIDEEYQRLGIKDDDVKEKVKKTVKESESKLDKLLKRAYGYARQVAGLVAQGWSMVKQFAALTGQTIDPAIDAIVSGAMAVVQYILSSIASFAAMGPYGIIGLMFSTVALVFAIQGQMESYQSQIEIRDKLRQVQAVTQQALEGGKATYEVLL